MVASDGGSPVIHGDRARLLPSPFPYQGSKRRLASRILRLFPRETPVLHEAFCGSAAVTLAAATSNPDLRVSLSDLDANIVNLWRAILENPDRLAAGYGALWEAQEKDPETFYYEVRGRFNIHRDEADFLFLLLRCVKSAVRYNKAGEFNQSPDLRRRGTAPSRVTKNLRWASQLLRGRSSIQQQEFENALTVAKPDDLIYMDPPYQGVSAKRDARYLVGLDPQVLVAGLEELTRRNLSFILSYDGKTGDIEHGERLPTDLGLTHLYLDAGTSSQATLLGRKERTVESLYLSPALIARLGELSPRELATPQPNLPLAQ